MRDFTARKFHADARVSSGVCAAETERSIRARALEWCLHARRSAMLAVRSFVLPFALCEAVSYTPWLWHPNVRITDPGESEWITEGMDVPRAEQTDAEKLPVIKLTEAGEESNVALPARDRAESASVIEVSPLQRGQPNSSARNQPSSTSQP
jgi:hypothetical protein